jgi:metallo-beta-lactamase family protein
MELSFHGAALGVTGSCHRIRAGGSSVLLDCGLFQGRRKVARAWNQELGFEAHEVGAVVQSHAHIDHSGRLPVLFRLGLPGKIHATQATREPCELLLADCAYILDKDAQYVNKQQMRDYGRSGLPLLRNPKPLLPADIVLTESTYGENAARASLRADLEASGYRQIDEPMPQQNDSIHS